MNTNRFPVLHFGFMKGWKRSLIMALWVMAGPAMASDLDPMEIRGKSSKEPINVLQNRAFLKSYRPEFGVITGFLLDEAYTNTTVTGLRGGMFINEWLGFEGQMARSKVSDSTDRKALRTLKFRPLNGNSANATPANGGTTEIIVSPDPEVNAIHAITDANTIVAPFYGKLNVLNKWIIYTDIYATGGLSFLETDQGQKTALGLGAGERFYIGTAWSIRVDFRDRIFTEDRGGEPSRRHSKAIDFGASYFIN